jgi:hypothetical protein
MYNVNILFYPIACACQIIVLTEAVHDLANYEKEYNDNKD